MANTRTQTRAAWWARMVLAPTAFYLLFYLILTHPLIQQFSTHYFLDDGDGLQNVWNMWWVNEAVTRLHQSPWYTQYLHAPHGVTLLAHTLNPFNGFVGIGLLRFMSLTEAVNTMIVFAFVCGGVTAFWLAHHVTRSYAGSLIGGYIFTFSAFHFAHAQGHMQLISLQWVPLFVLAWWVFVERPSPWRGAGAALALFLVLLCDFYYFFFCVVTGGLILVWRLWPDRWELLDYVREQWVSFASFVAVTLVTSGPLALSLVVSHLGDRFLGKHSTREFSMDLLAPLIYGGQWRFAWLTEGYWSKLPGNTVESSVHLGLAVIGVLVYVWMRRREIEAPSLPLWFGLGAVFMVLSLGPWLRVWGEKLPIPLPYMVLEVVVPPLKLSGVPVRMMVMVTLFAGILFSMGVQHYLARPRRQHVVGIVVLLVLFVDLLPARPPALRPELPAYVKALAELPGDDAVAVAEETAFRSIGLYYQTVHRKPKAFGYVSRQPTTVYLATEPLAETIQERDFVALRDEWRIRYLVVPVLADEQEDTDPPIVHEDYLMRVYDLGKPPALEEERG